MYCTQAIFGGYTVSHINTHTECKMHKANCSNCACVINFLYGLLYPNVVQKSCEYIIACMTQFIKAPKAAVPFPCPT